MDWVQRCEFIEFDIAIMDVFHSGHEIKRRFSFCSQFHSCNGSCFIDAIHTNVNSSFNNHNPNYYTNLIISPTKYFLCVREILFVAVINTAVVLLQWKNIDLTNKFIRGMNIFHSVFVLDFVHNEKCWSLSCMSASIWKKLWRDS